ncbi:hypothetical protein A9977_12125 [Variovorax sp. UMC13]|nr:hypothetical protein [Variovorax sp. UMC13]
MPTPGPQRYACSDDRYLAAVASTAPAIASQALFRDVYHSLLHPRADKNAARRRAELLLGQAIDRVAQQPDDLPDSPAGLSDWMEASARRATCAYQAYLASRKEGAPRRYFSNRAHALNFLQSVAPTKLVDGSWLYGTLRHRADPRMSGLAQTYLEELGNGDETKNHVLLYKKLLDANGLTCGAHLPDEYFEQGAIQLALGVVTQRMLPEVIGFNLGYEQLPLHLLITAFELDELGIDPYYFTLHVTVDNTDSGHAKKAIDAVALNASRYGDAAGYWRRVRTGYRLNDLGLGTTAAIKAFDVDAEVLRIFTAKSAAGAGAHSDYCRIGGRTVNEWLGGGEPVGAFLGALEAKGWIVKGADPSGSRFWQLLQGERAEMFGVFTDYELQVIFDWLRGDHSADGLRFDASVAERGARARSFRSQARLDLRTHTPASKRKGVHNPALGLRTHALPASEAGVDVLSPGHHWTPEGLHATQSLVHAERGGFSGSAAHGVHAPQGPRV